MINVNDKKIKICGIYKITAPDGKIYIGQSIDALKRFSKYRRLECKSQIKIYQSLVKYGYNKHKFDILSHCIREELTNLEKYYIKLFRSNECNIGLNMKLGGKCKPMSDETKNKISNSSKGKKITQKTREKLSLSHKGKPSPNKGKKLSEKWKQNLSNAYKLKLSNLDLEKIRELHKVGFTYSEIGKQYNIHKDSARNIAKKLFAYKDK